MKVLIAKPGLDGHDKGAKVVCHTLRDAGIEVIYTGLHKSVEEIVSAAIQEDVDAIGLSILSGAHLYYAEKIIDNLKAKDSGDITVFVGGVIPDRDMEKLRNLGVKGIFPGGSSLNVTADFLRRETAKKGKCKTWE
jgi:methylmalonyl-CoA mutase C-terminal domain/subunit